MPYGFDNSTDPRKASRNQRALITQGGDALQQQYANQYQAQQGGAPVNTVAGTANYLNSIEDPLAHGMGGYNASETGQIQLSPEDKQNIITGAGTSAGAGTAAQIGAADRSAAAAGGNPLAAAAYRARAADTEGAMAGDAMTRARVGAKEAESAGAQTTGNARLAQQNQGLNYYSGQNNQANNNSQQANQLQATTYGTESNAGNAATGNVNEASKNPTTTDKIIGGATSAAAAMLADGDVSRKSAVVGEDGPEWIGPKNYLDMGDPGSGEAPEFEGGNARGQIQIGDDKAGGTPFWQKMFSANKDPQPSNGGGGGGQKQWSPVDTYSGIGKAVGTIAKGFLEDGEMTDFSGDMMAQGGVPDWPGHQANEANEPWPPATSVPPRSMLAEGAIVTKPTQVMLEKNEAVVPLSYRAGAKVRPSMAMKPTGRQMYGQWA